MRRKFGAALLVRNQIVTVVGLVALAAVLGRPSFRWPAGWLDSVRRPARLAASSAAPTRTGCWGPVSRSRC
jgi:hypothetical protein